MSGFLGRGLVFRYGPRVVFLVQTRKSSYGRYDRLLKQLQQQRKGGKGTGGGGAIAATRAGGAAALFCKMLLQFLRNVLRPTTISAIGFYIL